MKDYHLATKLDYYEENVGNRDIRDNRDHRIINMFYGCEPDSFVYLWIMDEFIRVCMDGLGELIREFMDVGTNSFVYLWLLGEFIRVFIYGFWVN